MEYHDVNIIENDNQKLIFISDKQDYSLSQVHNTGRDSFIGNKERTTDNVLQNHAVGGDLKKRVEQKTRIIGKCRSRKSAGRGPVPAWTR